MNYIQVSTDKQIQQVAALAREIWTEHFTPIIGRAQVEYMLETIQSEDAITDQIRNHNFRYYLLEDSAQPIGYCGIVLKPGELFLSKLYILKPMRGKGLARKAIEFIESIAREHQLDKITLTCNKNNTGPIAAYEKLGFVNTGSIVADIGHGFIMDDYGMKLDLT